MARRREPKWHKPRAALVTSLGFGGWVMAGAAAFGELQMVYFGAICASCGLFIYAVDCGVQKLLSGRIRPEEVLRTDLAWAVGVLFVALIVGLAAPLYVHPAG